MLSSFRRVSHNSAASNSFPASARDRAFLTFGSVSGAFDATRTRFKGGFETVTETFGQDGRGSTAFFGAVNIPDVFTAPFGFSTEPSIREAPLRKAKTPVCRTGEKRLSANRPVSAWPTKSRPFFFKSRSNTRKVCCCASGSKYMRRFRQKITSYGAWVERKSGASILSQINSTVCLTSGSSRYPLSVSVKYCERNARFFPRKEFFPYTACSAPARTFLLMSVASMWNRSDKTPAFSSVMAME